MTKETKIGLLVGLAFIILFAIILSEKGASHRDTRAPVFSLAEGFKSAPAPSGAEQPLFDAGHLPVDSQLPQIVQPSNTDLAMSEEPVLEPEPAVSDSEPPLPPSLANALNIPKEETQPMGQAPDPAQSSSPTPDSGAGDSSVMTLARREPRPPRLEPLPSSITPPRSTGSLASADPAAHRPSTPTIIKTVHQVRPGESLGKIASRYYGRSTPARVEALYEANQDVLRSAHDVRAGEKLRIPDLGPHSDAFEPAPDFLAGNPAAPSPRTSERSSLVTIPLPIAEPAATKRASPPQGPVRAVAERKDAPPARSTLTAFRWYEVKKSDTLSKIAKRELGSSTRVSELYLINRDLLTSKHLLKAGMKIRVPARASSLRDDDTVITSRGDFEEP